MKVSYSVFWWVMLVRKWLLPCLLIGSVVVQTIMTELSIQQVLLNGLAVCFIMEVHKPRPETTTITTNTSSGICGGERFF